MIVAVASGGGHFVQLKRIMSSFNESDIQFLSTIDKPVLPDGVAYGKIPDCSLSSKMSLIPCFFILFYKLMIIRPKVIISTGAAPGFIALFVGKVFGAKTIWIDSIANADSLSLAGQKAKWVADRWYTQWPELACEGGPDYLGSVL